MPLLEAEPAVDRRLPYPRDWTGRWQLARELRRAGVDLALLLPNSLESALHARLAGARVRLGYAGDGRAGLLTHASAPPGGRRHQVALYLDLLRPLGLEAAATPPVLHVAPARRAEARRLLDDAGLAPGRRAVAVQLGAAFGPSKLWPPDRLAAVATVLEREGYPVVFLGGPTAGRLLEAVRERLGRPVRSLVGRDHPALLPALLAEFAVVLAPDSGPAHVAAAVGVPVVTLFGPTDPRLTAPLGEAHVALWRRPPCAPCLRPVCPIDHRCLGGLEVDEVVAALRERLADRGPA
jgi:heptosyltransferase-2